MLKILSSLILFASVGYSMQKETPKATQKIPTLTQQEILDLYESDNQSGGCCRAKNKLLVRCKEETEKVKQKITIEKYEQLSQSWSANELEKIIPFLIYLTGKEARSQLVERAEQHLKHSDFQWKNEAERTILTPNAASPKLKKFIDFQNNSLIIYKEQKAKTRIGRDKVQTNVNIAQDLVVPITLKTPQFIAFAFTREGKKLFSALS